MICYLALIWFVVYVTTVIRNICAVKDVGKSIQILKSYLDSASMSASGYFEKYDSYDSCKAELLKRYPVIAKQGSFYSATLAYGNTDPKTYRDSISLYNELLMTQNYRLQDLKESFNPLSSLKLIASFPSTLIRWIGFDPKEASLKIINILGWIVTYLLGMYSDEIKALVDLLLQKLAHT